VSIDFFVVPIVRNKVLFVLVVLAHHRRRVVHLNVTEHPTAQWTGQQIIEAFPWDTAPKYLPRDRDAIYGSQFQKRVQSMGIEEVLTAPRSPWQNAFVERGIVALKSLHLSHLHCQTLCYKADEMVLTIMLTVRVQVLSSTSYHISCY
jgi:putative transposase